jgi:hypothetical protein
VKPTGLVSWKSIMTRNQKSPGPFPYHSRWVADYYLYFLKLWPLFPVTAVMLLLFKWFYWKTVHSCILMFIHPLCIWLNSHGPWYLKTCSIRCCRYITPLSRPCPRLLL